MRERPDTDMARMLAVLNGGEVARRLNVTRTTVSDWSYAPDPPPARVIQVRELLLNALGQQEADPPEWASRLMERVNAIAEQVGTEDLSSRPPPGKERPAALRLVRGGAGGRV